MKIPGYEPFTSWLGAIDLGDAGLLLIALLLAVCGAGGFQPGADSQRRPIAMAAQEDRHGDGQTPTLVLQKGENIHKELL